MLSVVFAFLSVTRISNKFLVFGVHDLLCFEGRDLGFQSKMGLGFGMKVGTGCGIPKITIGMTGLSEHLGRDDGIKEPYWGTTMVFVKYMK